MARIRWDQIGEKYYETGVDHGVLYPQKNGVYPKGVAWNGLTAVNENPTGAEDNALYADNIKYLNLKSTEEYGATIECYTYPDEWAECNGESELATGVMIGQQRRNTFGFSYRTKKGNDTENEDYGYKLHLVYGASASPSEKSYATINDSPEAITFSFEITTTPVAVSGLGPDGKPFKPTASITIDSTLVPKEKMAALEEILYGTDATGASTYATSPDGDQNVSGSGGTDGRLPLPDEVKKLFEDTTSTQGGSGWEDPS